MGVVVEAAAICLPSPLTKNTRVLSRLWPDVVLAKRGTGWTRQKTRQSARPWPVELPQGTAPNLHMTLALQGRTGLGCKREGRRPGPAYSPLGTACSPRARAARIPPLLQRRRLRDPQLRGHAGRPAVNLAQVELGEEGAAAAEMGPRREICG